MFAIAFKDHHTYGNVDEVRPTHLSLDLKLDFERSVMEGVCELTLTYANPSASVAHLDLDINGLTIHSVKSAGRELRFEIDLRRPYMGQRLRIHLPTPTPEKVTVAYTTDPGAGALQWLAPRQTTSQKHPFLFTQSQAILARTWIPCMDSPGVRVSFDAVIRAPKGLQVVMSAEHRDHDPELGIFRFELPIAIPPYLIALAAGEIAFKPISGRTGVYAEPAILDKAAWEFADMERMVQAAEKLAGPYRWGRWDAIVLPPSFPFGGMENPLLTFATPTVIAGDRSLVSLMAHELAHSWSGNLVTNATWSDFWLNEGFTTYFERRIVEELYGKDIADMQQLLGQRDLRDTLTSMKDKPGDTRLHLNLDGRDPDEGMTDIAYEKGANFLTVLEHHFGRKRFDAFLIQYFDKYAFQSISTQVFLDYLDKSLLKDDRDAREKLQIDTWVFETGLPDNIIAPTSDKFKKTRAAAKAFVENGSLEMVDRETWVTAEWLDFLNSLPTKMTHAQLNQLNDAFKLSGSGNSEILFAWLRHCIRATYEPAFTVLEDFLTRQGRRKFLKPLYQALADNPKTLALGRRIYQKARPGYHPISTGAIDPILKAH